MYNVQPHSSKASAAALPSQRDWMSSTKRKENRYTVARVPSEWFDFTAGMR
jgi:hypothetical protein